MSTTAILAGFAAGASLIVAIGAQNAFVLRQGLRRDRIGRVVAVCVVSDLVLITAGVAGIGALIAAHPRVLTVATILGAAYLVWFGIRSLLAARRPQRLTAEGEDDPGRGAVRAGSVVLTTLALTWLNPHVYLDTVVLLGTLSASHGATGRWWFGLGAGAASIVWFVGLGYGSVLAARWLARPAVWRILDLVIGVLMLVLAAGLVWTALH